MSHNRGISVIQGMRTHFNLLKTCSITSKYYEFCGSDKTNTILLRNELSGLLKISVQIFLSTNFIHLCSNKSLFFPVFFLMKSVLDF